MNTQTGRPPFSILIVEKVKEYRQLIKKVAPLGSNVLIEGESGTGKELIARAVHSNSNRSQERFVVLNCGAIPPNLLESDLFGHERGAFTGAVCVKSGYFEVAHGGTIFLDEISEMNMDLQVKLLRVVQERRFEQGYLERALELASGNIAKTARMTTIPRQNIYEKIKKYHISPESFRTS